MINPGRLSQTLKIFNNRFQRLIDYSRPLKFIITCRDVQALRGLRSNFPTNGRAIYFFPNLLKSSFFGIAGALVPCNESTWICVETGGFTCMVDLRQTNLLALSFLDGRSQCRLQNFSVAFRQLWNLNFNRVTCIFQYLLLQAKLTASSRPVPWILMCNK
jgi:hypothetical protein